MVKISRLTSKCATQKLIKYFAALVCGHVYMVILKSQNKNTDFLMILA